MSRFIELKSKTVHGDLQTHNPNNCTPNPGHKIASFKQRQTNPTGSFEKEAACSTSTLVSKCLPNNEDLHLYTLLCYTFLWLYIHAAVYAQGAISVYICIYSCAYTRTYPSTSLCISPSFFLFPKRVICIYVYILIHTYMHIHIYVYIYIYIC